MWQLNEFSIPQEKPKVKAGNAERISRTLRTMHES